MKKLLLFMLVFVFGSAFSSIQEENSLPQSNKKREVPVKGTTGVPIFRYPVRPLIQVFICDSLLNISFLEPVGNVLVKLLDLETNEIVLMKTYYAQSGIVVDAFIDNVGRYQISFVAENYEGCGEFTVDN